MFANVFNLLRAASVITRIKHESSYASISLAHIVLTRVNNNGSNLVDDEIANAGRDNLSRISPGLRVASKLPFTRVSGERRIIRNAGRSPSIVGNERVPRRVTESKRTAESTPTLIEKG